MFFGLNSRLSSAEIVLHKRGDQTLYLIPKVWAFVPNVYDDRGGYTDQVNKQYRLRNGVGTIRITVDNDLELITSDCKAEIFLRITPENIQYLNILGTPPKWLKYAWFKFELTNLSEDDFKNYVYHGFSGGNRHILDMSLEQFISKDVNDIGDLGPALKMNPLFSPAFGFVGTNVAMVRTTFFSGVSLSNKQIVHYHIDQPLALVVHDECGEELSDKTRVWVNQHLKSKKELMDKFEEVILKRGEIGEEEIVQVFRVNDPKNKVMLLVRNRFSNEVTSRLLGSQDNVAEVTSLTEAKHSYESIFYEYRSKDCEVVAVMSGNSKFVNLDIFTTDPDVLTALFETQDNKIKFHAVNNLDELKQVIEIKDPKPAFDIVLYNGGLNLLSLPTESATIVGEIVEFLEDYLETEEGNW